MPVEDSVRKELESKFGVVDEQNLPVWDKLATFLSIFHLDVDDLYLKWESFNINKVQDDLPLTLPNLDLFQQYLQDSLLTKNTPSMKKSRDLQSSGIKIMKRPNSQALASSPSQNSTPNLKKRKAGEPSSSGIPFVSSPVAYDTANETFQSSSPIKKRPVTSSGTVIESLNAHIDNFEGLDLDGEPNPVKLVANFDAEKFKFRTMSMKLLESADVLDDQIDTFAQLYQEGNPNSTSPFGNPCLSSQNDIICAGRIVPDSPNEDTSQNYIPNKSSLFLETSRLSGIGQRIPLDLEHLKEYSFFPGQIVILKGNNPTGSSFVVNEALTPPDLGMPVSTKQELEELYQAGTNLKVVVASGPFSNPKTLDYEDFSSFVDHINGAVKPNVVILLGPFLDINNQAVANGDIDLPNEPVQPATLDELFKKLVTPILKNINPKIQVILIPSLSDTCVKHTSYPQDSFDRKKLGLPKNFKVFSNPSSFSINEVLIGCSNLDIFEDLKDAHLAGGQGRILNNRFERIANHIFEQRRYYPFLPGSIKRQHLDDSEVREQIALQDGIITKDSVLTTSGGSSLELPYLGLTELGNSLPDIMICPSKFKSFAKVIKGVIVINPGHFTRGNQGSYGVISVNAPDFEDSESVEKVEDNSEEYYHNIFKRARVDIVKS